MINRRNFLRASAAIAVGSVIGGKTIAQAVERRRITDAAIADYVKFQRTIRVAVQPGAIVVRLAQP